LNYNFVIKVEKMNMLEAYHESDVEIKRYFPTDTFELNQNLLQNVKIFNNDTPKLKIPKPPIFGKHLGVDTEDHNPVWEDDLDNAIKLYEAMRLNRVQANEPRLWAYLCHGPYYEFVRNRYSPNIDFVNYDLANFYNETSEIQNTMKNYVKTRFFTSGIRDIRRNGIAGLWWACDLTYAPWEKNSEIEKEGKDAYHYTKMILERPDLYFSTFERIYGREIPLIFYLLDFINDNNLGRNEYQSLIMKLNTNLAFSVFSIQSPKEIKNNIDMLANY
jgi:hypothetical protein|tara:strand:- start:104 stop:925 length:822 start_codon:yes stop_codon:yes gene_type:complete